MVFKVKIPKTNSSSGSRTAKSQCVICRQNHPTSCMLFLRYIECTRHRGGFSNWCLRMTFSSLDHHSSIQLCKFHRHDRNLSISANLLLLELPIYCHTRYVSAEASVKWYQANYAHPANSCRYLGPLLLLCFLIDPALWRAFKKAGCLGKARASPKPSQKIRNADIPPSRKYSLTGPSEDIEEDVIIQCPESAYLQSDGSNLSQTTH